MFQWRLKLREAKEAFADGQYDEATRLLEDPQLRSFLPAKQLASRLADRITDRAADRIALGQSAAGFGDLSTAEHLGGPVTRVGRIRRDYAAQACSEAVSRLVAGSPDSAAQRLERARRRGVAGEFLRMLAEVANAWTHARQLADQGEGVRAESAITRASRLLEAHVAASDTIPDRKHFDRLRDALHQEAKQIAERVAAHTAARRRLHEASAARDWGTALATVDELLRLAPCDRVALGLRRAVWKQMGLGVTGSHRPERDQRASLKLADDRPARGRADAQAAGRAVRRTTHNHRSPEEDTVAGRSPIDRRMLWIDSVGAMLVCLDDEVVLGQPSGDPANGPAVPILADLSRRHATIRREAGGYVLEPFGRVLIDGREITGATALPDNCLIQLGEGVRLRFEKPHALSATARITPESGHRLSPSADAVLLMAESCVMGPAKHCHVRCPDWEDDVILYRQGVDLWCRSTRPLEVAGETRTGPIVLSPDSRVDGQDFAFSIEWIDGTG